MGVVENIKNRGWEDIMNPKKWMMWIRHKINKSRGYVRVPIDDIIPFSEMVIFRASQCPQCVAAKKCVGKKDQCKGCSCPVPANMTEPGNSCTCEEWGSLGNKKYWVQEWENEKRTKNISIGPHFW